jgi:hypothetical protein
MQSNLCAVAALLTTAGAAAAGVTFESVTRSVWADVFQAPPDSTSLEGLGEFDGFAYTEQYQLPPFIETRSHGLAKQRSTVGSDGIEAYVYAEGVDNYSGGGAGHGTGESKILTIFTVDAATPYAIDLDAIWAGVRSTVSLALTSEDGTTTAYSRLLGTGGTFEEGSTTGVLAPGRYRLEFLHHISTGGLATSAITHEATLSVRFLPTPGTLAPAGLLALAGARRRR